MFDQLFGKTMFGKLFQPSWNEQSVQTEWNFLVSSPFQRVLSLKAVWASDQMKRWKDEMKTKEKCWMLIEVENGAMHHSPPCTHLLNLFQINNIVLGWCSLLWFHRPCLILQNSSPRTQGKNPKPETLRESCQFLSF